MSTCRLNAPVQISFFFLPSRAANGAKLVQDFQSVWKTWKFEKTFPSQGKVRETKNLSGKVWVNWKIWKENVIFVVAWQANFILFLFSEVVKRKSDCFIGLRDCCKHPKQNWRLKEKRTKETSHVSSDTQHCRQISTQAWPGPAECRPNQPQVGGPTTEILKGHYTAPHHCGWKFRMARTW